jgi:hypothetical protein
LGRRFAIARTCSEDSLRPLGGTLESATGIGVSGLGGVGVAVWALVAVVWALVTVVWALVAVV